MDFRDVTDVDREEADRTEHGCCETCGDLGCVEADCPAYGCCCLPALAVVDGLTFCDGPCADDARELLAAKGWPTWARLVFEAVS